MAASGQDRFDRIPDQPGRVGAHRGPATRGRGWFTLLWALLATVALVFGGLFVLSRWLDVDFGLPIFAQPTVEPTAPAVTTPPPPVTTAADLDPARGITIIVLNGTPLPGLQDTVWQQLADEGWPVTSRANAADREIKDTVVYYSDRADEDVARGLAASLGVGEIRQVGADTYPGARLTIVLGTDHPLVPQPEPAPTGEPGEEGSEEPEEE